MGDSDQKVFSGDGLNDNQWHTITFQRRGKTIELGVDESRPIIGMYLYSLSMRLYYTNYILRLIRLYVGRNNFQISIALNSNIKILRMAMFYTHKNFHLPK